MAGAIRGIDPRENTYVYAHAAGRHFRVRPTAQHGHGVRVTYTSEGQRVQTAIVPEKRVKAPARTFESDLRALLGIDPRKSATPSATQRILTVKPQAPRFAGRKTAAQLGLHMERMDWETVE